MKFTNKVNKFLENLSFLKFIITMTLCTILCSAMFGLVSYIFNIQIYKTNSTISNFSFISGFIVVVLIAPLLETLIFQYATINILRKIKMFKNNNLVIIFISSILFGLAHTYSLSYVIHTTVIGIFLAYSFIIYEKKEISPFWTVCTIHSLRNFSSLIFICFF